MSPLSHPLVSPPRRDFLARAAGLSLGVVLPGTAWANASKRAIRIGLTPVFLDDQVSFTARWRRWLEEQLDRPVIFVQRGNYREVVDLVRSGKIDFAWLCGFPYVRHRREMRLVAVPEWRGQPRYQSYLIADARNIGIRSLADLRGTVFAYSDPDSNSGFLYPQYALTQSGKNPATYFSRTFFTWAHRKVVEAVSLGIASGGAVDGYVWEMLSEIHPELTSVTRIIEKSPPLGYPPFVARLDIPETDLQRFRTVLLGMADDAQGAALLQRLRLDGFVPGSPDLYDGIARMAEKVRRS
ncbi:MAG: PhnD/SsuA/transferrin family substrate-binding protein [Rhodocyclaceae bacterium]|nr:PhnD/SsuA/transferrin family substrate-binding protein [Rhodocyclaceae bacterium]MDZ4215148.1 PhnD/SsuA/transferrin family substrate-binding protein [Rhodocyclaceae bacterium]